MAFVFLIVFGIMAFFGIRLLRTGWAARKTDHVGATVKLLFGWGFTVFGGLAFLVMLAVVALSGHG
jgi:heme/copper-type cytochrome/quinol oxidase subunit 2